MSESRMENWNTTQFLILNRFSFLPPGPPGGLLVYEGILIP